MARIHNISGLGLWIAACTLAWTPDSCPGLDIYRLGGGDLPDPPELGSAGVDFLQLPWEPAAAAGGEVFQAVDEEGTLELLKYDANVNIAAAWEERGGWISPSGIGHAVAFDGDHGTSWIVPQYLCAEMGGYFAVVTGGACDDDYGGGGTLVINLGGSVPLDRVVVYTGRNVPGTTVRNIRFHVAPVVPDKALFVLARPQSPYIEVRDNRADSLVVQLDPPQPVGFFQAAVGEHNTRWEIQEIEMYARGFVRQGSYVSNRIDLGEPAAWGDLRWAESADPGGQVFMRTRSGADDDPTLFWQRTGRGEQRVEVTRAEYGRLARGEQAGTTYDRDNWSLWSTPYDLAESAGTAITSLGPRRFLQFKIDFKGGGEAGGRVDFLEFRASAPPAASELRGEIAPIVADLGAATQFRYTLRPFIGA